MDALFRALGQVLTSILEAGYAIGDFFRSIIVSADSAFPPGVFPILVFGVLVAIAWALARR